MMYDVRYDDLNEIKCVVVKQIGSEGIKWIIKLLRGVVSVSAIYFSLNRLVQPCGVSRIHLLITIVLKRTIPLLEPKIGHSTVGYRRTSKRYNR